MSIHPDDNSSQADSGTQLRARKIQQALNNNEQSEAKNPAPDKIPPEHVLQDSSSPIEDEVEATISSQIALSKVRNQAQV